MIDRPRPAPTRRRAWARTPPGGTDLSHLRLLACALAALLVAVILISITRGSEAPAASGSSATSAASTPSAAGRRSAAPEAPATSPERARQREALLAVPEPDPDTGSEASQEGASPWRATRYQGRHAMADFREVFDASIDAARAGDPDAMLRVAFALENCHVASNFPTREAFSVFLRSRPGADPEEVAAVAALIPDCRHLAAAVPDDTRLPNWTATWIERAANAGHPLARFLSIELWPPTQSSYDDAVDALSAAVALGDPFAYREAADFVSDHPSPVRDDPFYVEASAWLTLACEGDPGCDVDLLRSRIAANQLPVYAEEIDTRAQALASRIERGDPIDLDTGWQAPDSTPDP